MVLRSIAVFAAVGVSFFSALAGPPGAGELMLDRGTVTSLLQANLPGPVAVPLPTIGRATLKLSAPDPVRFVEGGVETSLAIEVVELGLTGNLAMRYVPEIDTERGAVVLRPVRALPEGMLRGLPDLASMLAPVELPKTFDWIFSSSAGADTRFTVNVQGIEVTAERLIVKIGLVTAPLPQRDAKQKEPIAPAR